MFGPRAWCDARTTSASPPPRQRRRGRRFGRARARLIHGTIPIIIAIGRRAGLSWAMAKSPVDAPARPIISRPFGINFYRRERIETKPRFARDARSVGEPRGGIFGSLRVDCSPLKAKRLPAARFHVFPVDEPIRRRAQNPHQRSPRSIYLSGTNLPPA